MFQSQTLGSLTHVCFPPSTCSAKQLQHQCHRRTLRSPRTALRCRRSRRCLSAGHRLHAHAHCRESCTLSPRRSPWKVSPLEGLQGSRSKNHLWCNTHLTNHPATSVDRTSVDQRDQFRSETPVVLISRPLSIPFRKLTLTEIICFYTWMGKGPRGRMALCARPNSSCHPPNHE